MTMTAMPMAHTGNRGGWHASEVVAKGGGGPHRDSGHTAPWAGLVANAVTAQQTGATASRTALARMLTTSPGARSQTGAH